MLFKIHTSEGGFYTKVYIFYFECSQDERVECEEGYVTRKRENYKDC